MTRIVLVPGVLALLPEYAGVADPVADLRAACLEAVSSLGNEVTVVGETQGERVAAYLLAATLRNFDEASVLVVGNGSARRTEKAPGHLDERADTFDADLGRVLRAGDTDALRDLDRDLAADLLAVVGPIAALAGLLPAGARGEMLYDDDPFGVKYWVMRWDR